MADDDAARAQLPVTIVEWCETEAPGPLLYTTLLDAYQRGLRHFPTQRQAERALMQYLRHWRKDLTRGTYGPTHPQIKD